MYYLYIAQLLFKYQPNIEPILFFLKSTKIMQILQNFCSIRERSSITSARLGGVGGLSQNADTADALEGGGGSKPKC